MRILVAGAQGQVAQAMAELTTPHQLVALGRPELDLTQPPSIAAALDRHHPDVVINAAAYTAVDKAETDEAACFAVNADGAGALAGEAAARGAMFLHLSTDYVFDGSKPTPYVESDPTAPLGVYGRSKRAGEEAVLAAHPGAYVLRTAWVYHHGGANFVRTMLRLAETRDEVGVVADQVGCPTYAPDIASALVGIAEMASGSDKPAGIFNLAGSAETTWHGFANAVFADLKRRGLKSPRLKAIGTSDYPTPARRPANSRLDGSKLKAAFGIVPAPWSDALPRCLDRLLGGGAKAERHP